MRKVNCGMKCPGWVAVIRIFLILLTILLSGCSDSRNNHSDGIETESKLTPKKAVTGYITITEIIVEYKPSGGDWQEYDDQADRLKIGDAVRFRIKWDMTEENVIAANPEANDYFEILIRTSSDNFLKFTDSGVNELIDQSPGSLGKLGEWYILNQTIVCTFNENIQQIAFLSNGYFLADGIIIGRGEDSNTVTIVDKEIVFSEIEPGEDNEGGVESGTKTLTPTPTFTITPTPTMTSTPRPTTTITPWAPTSSLPPTGFSAHNQTVLPQQPASVVYRPTGFVLDIPTLNIQTEIVGVPRSESGWEVAWLGNRAGLLEGSALPGRGESYLSGHNHLNDLEAGPFLFLSTLEENDRIFVRNASGKLLEFSVYANELYGSDAMRTIQEKGMDYPDSLILVTCENESIEGGYLDRRVVFARPL